MLELRGGVEGLLGAFAVQVRPKVEFDAELVDEVRVHTLPVEHIGDHVDVPLEWGSLGRPIALCKVASFGADAPLPPDGSEGMAVPFLLPVVPPT